RIDFHKVPEGATDRVVDQHLGRAEFAAYRFKRGVELRFICNVAWICARVRNLIRKLGETLAISREHRNRVSAARKTARDRGASSRPDSSHECNGILFIHRQSPLSLR